MKKLFFVLTALFLLGCTIPQEVEDAIPTVIITPFPTSAPTPVPDIRVAEKQAIEFEEPLIVKEKDGKQFIVSDSELSYSQSPDLISSIDFPEFNSTLERNLKISGSEMVVGVFYNGEAKAYPVRILNWHEVVNDNFRGEKIVVVYSPLTFAAAAFKRASLDFGVSGKFYLNTPLLYDRQTQSLWHSWTGFAIQGQYSGDSLESIPVFVGSFGEWNATHPDTKVLDAPRGTRAKPYNTYPYGNYNSSERLLFPSLSIDQRLRAKEPVLGVGLNGYYKAYKISTMPNALNDELAGTNLVLLKNPVNNETRLFDRRDYLFFANETGLFDSQTFSQWNFDGSINSTRRSNLRSAKLDEVPSIRLYWFAWSQFHAKTGLER
ncbi:DUF3179 domain-containing protein [Candidatus Micrarchaeota archaeon]|nr:DUF3179 domain-containing protein [Candidatus Micrarchaeota archaeon]